MSGFKLLAIRPLKDCSQKYRKLLVEGQVYSFYQEFEFKREDDNDIHSKIKSIVFKELVPMNLYNCTKPNIQVSAVVGKNGSGKSTLLELLFLVKYIVAIHRRILKPNPHSVHKKMRKLREEYDKKKVDELKELKEYKNLKQQSDQFKLLLNSVKVELFFSLGENIFCLRINNSLKLTHIDGDKTAIRDFKINDLLQEKSFDFEYFFYTIAINYSLYGLNTNFLGDWIESLFHKNDAYQTPIVINPYRENGNINVNTEIYLSKQRLISNLLKPFNEGSESKRKITDYQIVKNVLFSLNTEKVKFAYHRKVSAIDEEIGFDQLSYEFFDNKDQFIMQVVKVFLGENFDTSKMKSVKYYDFIEKYIIKKLIQIARTYTQKYGKYFSEKPTRIQNHTPGSTQSDYTDFPGHRFQGVKDYLDDLIKDDSHITFKLRQAVNYLKTDPFKSCKLDIVNLPEGKKEALRVSVEDLSQHLFPFAITQKNLIRFIPPSLFDIELELQSIYDKDAYSYFSMLSSGEQQLIQSIQSILYHINNLDSVHLDNSNKNPNKKIYSHINVVLDEVELYFHPEFQRKFVDHLIEGIKSLEADHIQDYNILFATHSPFILSDIPSSNILKLDEGVPKSDASLTFGANIHDLLDSSFFMSSSIGDFSLQKIQGLVDFYHKVRLSNENQFERLKLDFEAKKKDFKFLINNVGEDVYREILNNHYSFLKETFNPLTEEDNAQD
jgi:hypothetical protein